MSDSKFDWERIETQYRAGILSVREIARDNGVSHTAIQKRADAGQWDRDLNAKIKAKADALVAKKLVAKKVASGLGGNQQDRDIVQVYGEAVADVRTQHMDKATANRLILEKMIAELDTQNELREEFSKLGEIMADPEARKDTLSELYHKVISFSGRVDSGKKLMEAWAKLVEVERKVYGIKETDGSQPDPRSPEEILERLAYLEAKRRAAEE